MSRALLLAAAFAGGLSGLFLAGRRRKGHRPGKTRKITRSPRGSALALPGVLCRRRHSRGDRGYAARRMVRTGIFRSPVSYREQTARVTGTSKRWSPATNGSCVTDVPNADRFCVPVGFLSSRFVPSEQIVRGDLQHPGNGFDFDIGENTAAVFYAASESRGRYRPESAPVWRRAAPD